MNYRTMTIQEDEGQYPIELQLWRNANNQLYIQIGPVGGDPCEMQSMVMGIDDAIALRDELSSIIADMDACRYENNRLEAIDKPNVSASVQPNAQPNGTKKKKPQAETLFKFDVTNGEPKKVAI